MNKVRRKEISRAIEEIEKAKEILEAVIEEEQESFDNLPESLQASKRGERMEEIISILDDYLEILDTDDLQEIIDY